MFSRKEFGKTSYRNDEEHCKCFQKNILWSNLSHPSRYRISVAIGIIALMTGLAIGLLSGKAEMWVKVTLMITFAFALLITVIVPTIF